MCVRAWNVRAHVRRAHTLTVEKERAITEWRRLIGPTDSAKARAEAEAAHPLNEDLWSIRALYGVDARRNAVHGSDRPSSAEREISFFFKPSPPAASRFSIRSIVLTD